jgi:hypothetical protein
MPTSKPDKITFPTGTAKFDPNGCTWTEDEEGIYQTSCDEQFVFNSETATDNGFNFCPFCGKPIKDIPYSG